MPEPSASTITSGPFLVACCVLLVSGVAKVVRPRGSTAAMQLAGFRAPRWAGRALGFGETVLAGVAIASGASVAALLVAVTYLSFAAFLARLARRHPGADCGCFGTTAPVSRAHLLVNVALAVAALAAAVSPPGALGDVLAEQPLAGIPFLVLVLAGVRLAQLCASALPALRRTGGAAR